MKQILFSGDIVFAKIYLHVFFHVLSSFVKKKKDNNDEDLVVDLYCEEINDPPSVPSSTCRNDCQQMLTGGKVSSMLFIATAERHDMM